MARDNSKLKALLIDLGLSNNEALTYSALLDTESVSIRKVSDRSGINRGTTHQALKSLVNQGLVHVKRKNQRDYYSAESPEVIFEIIKTKRKDLMQTAEEAKELIPDLLAKNARPQGKPLVRYYEDDEGVVTILRDVLQTCRQLEKPEYYAYSSKPLRQYLYRKFPRFTDQRIKESINVKVIAIGEGGELVAASERKWMKEPDGGEISSYTIIYGSKVAHISISSDFTPYGVVIEDAGTAAMQRLLFDQLWQKI